MDPVQSDQRDFTPSIPGNKPSIDQVPEAVGKLGVGGEPFHLTSLLPSPNSEPISLIISQRGMRFEMVVVMVTVGGHRALTYTSSKECLRRTWQQRHESVPADPAGEEQGQVRHLTRLNQPS
jgi:hypothetical protein